MVGHACNPGTWEVETGSGVQRHLLLYSEFEVSLGCIRAEKRRRKERGGKEGEERGGEERGGNEMSSSPIF